MIKEIEDITMLSELLIKVAAIERLLLIKGYITKEELSKETEDIARFIAKSMLKHAKIPGDLDKILEDLITGEKEKDN
jgi:hypothetical protein